MTNKRAQHEGIARAPNSSFLKSKFGLEEIINANMYLSMQRVGARQSFERILFALFERGFVG